jgi:holo-[acyl-carrier protein] synthase
MRVIGIGVDLVEVPRFQRALIRWGSRLMERLFTQEELAYAASSRIMAQHLAARFAAKEAVIKALGVPKGLGLRWRDLEIARASTGRPGVRFHGTFRRWRSFEVHLSLTHTHRYAIATAWICRQ